MIKKVYAGKDSIAKIKTRGAINTNKEIMMVGYALAYDLSNLELLDKNGNLIRADEEAINRRFGILYSLITRFTKSYKVRNAIKRLHNLALMRLRGMNKLSYIMLIRGVAYEFLSLNEINMIERNVDSVNDYIHSPFWKNYIKAFGFKVI